MNMLTSNFNVAWRSMFLNRMYAATNIVGLTLGLTVILLITSLVLDELSYDRHWTLSDELFRVRLVYNNEDGQVKFRSDRAPVGLGSALKANFPEVLGYTTVDLSERTLVVDSLSNHYAELDFLESDTNFFTLFDVRVLAGNPKQMVGGVKNLVITEHVHQKYFGGKDVIGKIYQDLPKEGQAEPYIIRAIVQDLPQNTHLHADAIVISSNEPKFEPGKAGSQQSQIVRIKQYHVDSLLAAKLQLWFSKQHPEAQTGNTSLELQPIQTIHLGSESGWDGPKRDLLILTSIGVLILILVCVNFINLTFAHAVKRTLETGIRKVLGAGRIHLFIRMGTESVILFGGSLILGLSAYILALPAFEQFIGHPLTVTFHRSFLLLIALAWCWITIGLLCSLFPALSLSKTKATYELKKRLFIVNLPLNIGITRGLIVLQFTIAIVVVLCMLTIRSQLRYMDKKDLGYEPHNLLVVDFTAWEGKAQAFKQSLQRHSSISSASFSWWSPFSGSADFMQVTSPTDPEQMEHVAIFTADFDYVRTMGITLTEGRMLQPDQAFDAPKTDSASAQEFNNVLATETTKKHFNLTLNQSSPALSLTTVGTIQDFHAASLHHAVANIIIKAQRDWDMGCLLVRAAPGREKEALAAVTATWNKFFPNRLSRFNWLEDQVKGQYEKERKQFQQLAFFSGISMLLALLGVLGIVVYTIERRVKEIGIRKVLGASIHSIVTLLSASFSKLVAFAMVLAFPIAWWLMHSWLDNFAYRIDMPIHLFVITGLFTFCALFAVVGFRALRAAMANPVDSLRDE